MIYKRCAKCGKRMTVGSKCNCTSTRRYKEKQTDDYYLTDEWRIARELCIRSCFGLDIFAFYYKHEISYGFTVHHIYPLKDYFSLRKTQKNLIYLTEQNHRLVHKMLKEDFTATVKMLENFKTLFYEEFLKRGGDYQKVLFELPQTALPIHLSQNSK